VQTLTASFEIESGVYTVTGTKTLRTNPAVAFGTCAELQGADFSGPFVDVDGTVVESLADCSYRATIQGPEGTFHTEGDCQLRLQRLAVSSATTGFQQNSQVVEETFLSGPVTSSAPTSADQCKQNGFQSFGTLAFKNQGDCVAYVETAGKNEPGQNIPHFPPVGG
jgi:hypothetical protein